MKNWTDKVASWLVGAWIGNVGIESAQTSDPERRIRELEERGRKLFLP